MHTLGVIIDVVLRIFIALMLVRLVVEWIQVFARSWTPRGPVLVFLEGVYSITDPPILALRRVIKPVRIGGIALDLSFLVVLLVCYVLVRLNYQFLL